MTLIFGRTRFAFLSKPGQADLQSDLFYDYRANVEAYPNWQAWIRKTQPQPEAYRRGVPNAEVPVLNAGHFALDLAADRIGQLVRGFMK